MENTITKKQMDIFWKKKEFIYFLLSILVFLIHTSSFAQYSANDGIMALVNAKVAFFFKDSITRFAVPMYFILSGMLFFRDYTNKKYISKMKSRFFSLCVPYLLWNTLWLIIDIASSYTFLSAFFSTRPLTTESVLKSIFLAEWNLPFWFILYLIVFVFISPVFDLLTKNKYIGIVVFLFLTALSVFEFDSIRYDSVVYYFLGVFLGKYYFNFFAKKSNRKNSFVAVFYLLLYIILKNIFPESSFLIKPIVQILVLIMASYSVWAAVDLFIEKIPFRPLYKRSFAVFALHTNVSAVICKVIYFLFPKNEYFALPNFVLTFIFTLVSINIFCIVSERCLPRIYALLTGKGLKIKQSC